MGLSGRKVLIVAFVGVFIWEVVISVAKYSYSRVGLTFKNVLVAEEKFPSISICPVSVISTEDYYKISFEDYYDNMMDPKKFLKRAWQTHYGSSTDIHPDTMSNGTDASWEVNVGYNSCSYVIPACLTFTPLKKFKKGLHSLVVFEIDTRRTNNLLLFFHEPRRTFVVEDIFGMDVLQLPKVPDSTKEPTSIKMVKVTPTLLQKLSKDNLPCSNDPSTKERFLPCLEDHIESRINCSLPWRSGKRETEEIDKRICSTVEDMNLFREHSLELSFANEETIYQLTGCYYSCEYTSYSSRVTFENAFADAPGVDEAGFAVQAWVHLSPKATEVRTEIVVYDFYSLIGDIGGVMGLLLGTSFLSLYDTFREFVKERVRTFSSFPLGGAGGGKEPKG